MTPSRRVLIVDDSETDRELYRRYLQRSVYGDYDIQDAELGEEGLAACSTQAPDCILLDYRLPDISGIEFLERLPGLTNGDLPAVVIITADGNERVVVEALQRGAQDYLAKDTTSSEQLGRVVHHAIEKRALQRSLEAQQRTLAQSEARFRALIERSWDVVALVTADGMLQYVSPAVLQVLGYTTDELLGQNMFTLIHPDDWAALESVWQNVIQQPGAHAAAQYRYCHKDGSWRWIDGVATNLLADPHVRAVVVNYQDITKRKLAEEALVQYTRDLARAHADLRQVAYIAAHDLQEPVRQVGIYTQFLAKRFCDVQDTHTQEALTFIVEGTGRMQAQFTDLMHYLEIEESDDGLTTTDCEFLLQNTLEALRDPIARSGAVVTHEALPTIRANAKQLQLVFQELLDNAVKFRLDTAPHVHVWAERIDGGWRFAIRDDGIGIASEGRGQLFRLFRKLQRRTDYPGTGMGLALCKKIIERHGGRIWLESTPGEGSTFFFTITENSSQ